VHGRNFCCVVWFVELLICFIFVMACKRHGKYLLQACSESKTKMEEKDQQVIFQALSTFQLNCSFQS